jgi:hypothetical protein
MCVQVLVLVQRVMIRGTDAGSYDVTLHKTIVLRRLYICSIALRVRSINNISLKDIVIIGAAITVPALKQNKGYYLKFLIKWWG